MFGLPPLTTFVLFGFPLFWILYTAVFLWISRGWVRDEQIAQEADR